MDIISAMKLAKEFRRRLFLLLSLWCGVQIVQAFPPGFTKVQVENGTFHLEFDGSAGEGCVLEIADSPGGPWSGLPQPELNSPVIVPLEGGSRYFRFRCAIFRGQSLSFKGEE
jgi:hypothetical protein